MAVLRQIAIAWQRSPLAPLYPPAKKATLSALRMKEAAAAADGVVYADVVRHLFGLGEESET